MSDDYSIIVLKHSELQKIKLDNGKLEGDDVVKWGMISRLDHMEDNDEWNEFCNELREFTKEES